MQRLGEAGHSVVDGTLVSLKWVGPVEVYGVPC